MKVSRVLSVIVLGAAVFAMDDVALIRDLQEQEESSQIFQKTQEQIALCPQCRSADEIQETGFLRSLFGHVMIWWFSRRQVETAWFTNALQGKEISRVNVSQRTSMSEQLRTKAQMLRQNATSLETSSIPEVEQFELLLTDFLASSLDAVSTLMDQMKDNWMSADAIPVLDSSGQLVVGTGFVQFICEGLSLVTHALLCSFRLLRASDSTVFSLMEEMSGTTIGGTLDHYTNAILSSLVDSDISFIQLQGMAEERTLDLTVKRDALLLFAEQTLLSNPIDVAWALIRRILDVMVAIVVVPVKYFAAIAFAVYATVYNAIFNPFSGASIGIALIILLLLIVSPFIYVLTILEAALIGLENICGCFFCGRTDVVETLTLMKKNPFAFTMGDVECQIDAISCQSDAWVQMLPPS